MHILLNIVLVIATFFFMEFIAWFTHKYVMHGWGWFLHKDHHVHGEGKTFFEKNDSFFIIFAVPSFLLLLFGSVNEFDHRFWMGTGIAMYGLCYFLLHDLFIHQRFKIFTRSKNTYLMALRKAHKVHHKHLTKEHGECFGMLIVPFKYWKEAIKSLKK
ncbi:MAG: beta-carotene 3-hydroxylase [Flavobacteriales bacterium]|jgi:beta-carotene 3-hydroxylase